MTSPPLDALPAAPSFEVLVIYGVVCVVAIAGAKLISTLAVSMLDSRTVALLGEKKSKGSASRSDGGVYVIGTLPRAREILGVAYLKDRVDGVARVIVAEAIASGWLLVDRDRIHVGPLEERASREERDLLRELGYGTITRERVDAAAKRVALSLEPALAAELESAGLFRTWTVRRLGELIAVIVAAPAIWMGLSRLLEGARARAGIEGGLVFLALEVVGFALIAFAVARVPDETELAGKYLAWLEDATSCLREDVASGRADRTPDVLLATALGS